MKKLSIAVAALLGVMAAACGGGGHDAGSGSGSTRDVAIEMRDIAYSPTTLSVKKGDTVKFTFTNKGAIVHEALIGDSAAQDAHAQEMASGSSTDSMDSGDSMGSTGGGSTTESMAGMDQGSGSNMLSVDPGKSGTLRYTFDKAGTVIIGCHEPGHYEAGMKVTVTVS